MSSKGATGGNEVRGHNLLLKNSGADDGEQ